MERDGETEAKERERKENIQQEIRRSLIQRAVMVARRVLEGCDEEYGESTLDMLPWVYESDQDNEGVRKKEMCEKKNNRVSSSGCLEKQLLQLWREEELQWHHRRSYDELAEQAEQEWERPNGRGRDEENEAGTRGIRSDSSNGRDGEGLSARLLPLGPSFVRTVHGTNYKEAHILLWST